jgi:hypothetical protein
VSDYRTASVYRTAPVYRTVSNIQMASDIRAASDIWMPSDYRTPSVYGPLFVYTGVEGTALRKAYAKEFKASPTLKDWAKKKAPSMRTKASSIASGKRVEKRQSKPTDEAYKAVDVFTRLLWYHDKNKHVIYDNAHQFANVLKQMMNSIKDTTKKDKLQFNTLIRQAEAADGTPHTHIAVSEYGTLSVRFSHGSFYLVVM